MKLDILHLSDFHFKRSDLSALALVDATVKAAKSLSAVDATSLVAVTGDIAFSGTKDQYATASELFQTLDGQLHSVLPSISWAFVPGNHDCNFDVDSAARNAVIRAVGPGIAWDNSVPQICTAVQTEYFAFASERKSILRFDPSKVIANATFTVEGHKVSIWGINSAWMSQKHDVPGSIWFPTHLLQQELDNHQSDINILLLHHPFAWFHTQVRRDLLRLMESSFTLILGGHEHLPESWARDDLKNNRTVIIEGGAYQEASNKLDGSSFNFVSIDFTNSNIETTGFVYDGKRYVPGATKLDSFNPTRASTKPYRQLSEKCSSFLRSAGATFRHPARTGPLDLQDIYVEPDLLDIEVARDSRQIEKLASTRQVLSEIQQQPYVVVSGADKAGKSSWLRWAYVQLHSFGLTPVRIEGALLRSSEEKRVSKLIADEYRQQYEVTDNVAWDQLDFGSRALLIDDFDACPLNSETRAGVLEKLTLQFGCIFITCDDALMMRANGASSEFEGFKKYELPEFGHRLRDALISKWIKIGREGTLDYPAFQLLRDQRARSINSLLGQSFIPSRPIFLLTLLQSMESGAESTIRGSSLGEYYEYLIRNALIGARVEPRDLDAVLNYLTEMAYCLIQQQSSHLNSASLSAFDANFSSRYALLLKFDHLHKQLRDADILEEWNDQIRFKYRYVLLFFGARYLARHFDRDAEVTRQVHAVVRNSATTKYADLLLFIVHHSNDPAVLDLVLAEATKVFADLPPMKLDDADMAPINGLVEEVPKLALSSESVEARRERNLRARDANSRRASDASDVSDLSLSALQDADTNKTLDWVQRLSLGLRLMGILGQVLRNYYGSLKAERKELIASASYSLLGRMLRSYFDEVVKDRDGLSDYISQKLGEKGDVTRERARSYANRLVFGLTSLLTFVLIKRTAEFLGSDKLLPTHEKVAGTVDTPLSRLVGLAISLEYPATGSSGAPRPIPLSVLEDLYREFSNNPCAAFVLRRLVVDYLYMFEVSYKDKHQICETLGIAIKTQQQIALTSKRKKTE